jgi:hypothetical protein
MGDSLVKISKPAVLITAVLAAAVTACSSSSPSATGKPRASASPGITAGPGKVAALSSDPVCRKFQKDLNAWKTAVTEPGDASTILINASTRSAWTKFGRQLDQLSHAAAQSTAAKKAAQTKRDLARTASLVTLQGTEPLREVTGAQYQRTVAQLQYVTSDCTVLPGN